MIKLLLAAGSLMAAVTGLASFGGLIFLAFIANNLPSPQRLETLLNPQFGTLLQPTRIFDRTGENQIAVLSPWDTPRIYTSIDQAAPHHLPIPLMISTATVLEPGFWTNTGISVNGWDNPDEHPTIAQKLVFNLLLWNEPAGIKRALRERILAALVTSRYGKEKILEWYLNSADYGHFAYGADSAARYYLGKPVEEINLAESALLTSISQQPSINPIDTPFVIRQHQVEILDMLSAANVMPESEIENAKKYRLVFRQDHETTADLAPAFTNLVLRQLEEQARMPEAAYGGIKIISTLDFDLQVRTSCIIHTQFLRMELAGVDVTSSSNQSCPGGDLLPPLPVEEKAPFSASAAVLDPHTGQVLALVGDSSKDTQTEFLTPQHPGFLLTPFVYLTGFSRGLSPASLVWDLPSTGSANENSGQNGLNTARGPLRIRTAMTDDLVPAGRKIYDQMGPGLIQKTMLPFGLDIRSSQFDSLIDTENRYSVIQIARAFGVFANLGNMAGLNGTDDNNSSTINSITGLDGEVYKINNSDAANSIVNPQLAYLVNDVFSVNIPALGRPISMKTSLTIAKTDAWTVGYTPNRVVTVWTGGNDLTDRPAAGIWQAIMLSAVQQLPPDGWKMPEGMVKLKVCDPSGMLPTTSCPNIVDEIFIDGYQPTQTDTLYQSYAINRETGLLATVFTPDELVENRIFMQIPSEAMAWASSANLPVPPTQYDSIQPPNPNQDGNITSPKMFDEIEGVVQFTGTADGSDFSSYRLQYGKGMKPEEWVQIGSDSKIPVQKGKLAVWDTNGLHGLYSVQLLVIHQDQSFLTATIQVTLK